VGWEAFDYGTEYDSLGSTYASKSVEASALTAVLKARTIVPGT